MRTVVFVCTMIMIFVLASKKISDVNSPALLVKKMRILREMDEEDMLFRTYLEILLLICLAGSVLVLYFG